MTALLTSTFLASFLGSLHCAGMCGPIAALAASPAATAAVPAMRPLRVLRSTRHSAAYNLGRLACYVALGLVAGGLGAAMDLGGRLIGAQQAAAALSGTALVMGGVAALARSAGLRVAQLPSPPGLRSLLSAIQRRIAGCSPGLRAASLGMLSGLLPCGWLYAFVLIAAGTADPLRGGLAMTSFWAGSVPILLLIGIGSNAAIAPLRARAPLLISLAMITLGLMTIGHRVERADAIARKPPVAPAGLEQSLIAAREADQHPPACCLTEEAP